MAATEEWAQRACLRMADVTVMHSVTTSATGLTATGMRRGSVSVMASWSESGGGVSMSSLDMLERSVMFEEVRSEAVVVPPGAAWREGRRLCGQVSKLMKCTSCSQEKVAWASRV